MEIIKIEKNKAEINLSLDEVFALRQAFFMVRHSKIDNFKQTIGASNEETKELMNYFGDLKNRINPNSSGTKTIINRKNCNLRSQEYDLCFYMKKMNSTIEDIRYLVALQKKGINKAILKTVWDTISIKQIRQDLILLKDKANSLNNETDTVSVSLFNEAVEILISNSKSKESDSAEKPLLNVEFVFPRGIEFSYVDLENSPETKKENPFDSPKSFSSTLTLENITNFITKVEDFLENRVNNNLN